MSTRIGATRTRKASTKTLQNSLVSDISEHFKKANGDSQDNEKESAKKNKNNEKQALNEHKALYNNKKKGEEKTPLISNQEAIDSSDKEQENEFDHDKDKEPEQNTQTSQTSQTSHEVSEAEKQNGRTVGEEEINEDEEELIPTSKKEILIAIRELTTLVTKLDNDIHHPKNGIGAQLVKVNLRMDNLYTDIHGAVSGVIPKLNQAVSDVHDLQTRMSTIETSNKRLIDMLSQTRRLGKDISTMQGIIQKNSQQLQHTNTKLLDLTKRGMEQNLMIYGVDDSVTCWDYIVPMNQEHTQEHELEQETNRRDRPQKELYKHSVIKFLQTRMRLDLEVEDIWKAHRVGMKRSNRCQPMIVKVSYAAKELIMENISSLKDQVDGFGQALFIKEQIPEGIIEKKKQTSARLRALKKENEDRPQEQKNTITVIQDRIVVNGLIDKPEVQTPQPRDLFPDLDEQKKIDEIAAKIQQTDPQNVKNSSFVGHAVTVQSTREVNLAYKALAQRYPAVDHIFMAYALKEEGQVKHNHCDDNEHGGGNCIHRVLLQDKIKDTAIFIARRYGGLHLGLDRFQVIEQVTKQSIKLLHPDYVSKPREEKKRNQTENRGHRAIRGGRNK